MTRDADDPMEAEFDTVADWTARVAADLGPEYYIPAACRGSGRPAMLDWLLERLGPRPGEVMIDVGAGLGGPAAYATHRIGVQPILAEPEPDACRAAARQARALLAIPGVAGVNISGLASARGYEFAARIKAELAARIREGAAA